MSMSRRRVRAIFRKELREYRRNGSIVSTMAIIPLIFILPPLINIFALPASASSGLLQGHPLLYLLGIPAIVPAVVAAYSVVGERQQGTLEPVLTTPIRREEFLLGKALAALLWSGPMQVVPNQVQSGGSRPRRPAAPAVGYVATFWPSYATRAGVRYGQRHSARFQEYGDPERLEGPRPEEAQ